MAVVTPTGAWSADELAAFLDEATVPIRLACRTPGGGLWMLSLWYDFDDGDFVCATSADADIVDYLAADDGVAFEVSTNDPPYRGVRGAGVATVEPDPEKTVLRGLVERYLGSTDSAFARWLLSEERDEVTVRIDPRRLYTWDFGDRMRDATD